MSRALKLLPRIVLPVMIWIATALPAAAQALPGADVGAQNLRAYHFLFLAYALVWILVFGWVVSIARRLKRLEKQLDR